MPNVTVTIPAEIYRRARVWAAANNTTVTALVRDILDVLPRFSAARISQLRAQYSPGQTPARLLTQVRAPATSVK